MFERRIREIPGKLEKVRQIADWESWFGAGKHRFQLCAPLPESELLNFESAHAVRLPADYREFLLLAGNGGAGPYYGIEPLSAWDTVFEEEAETPDFLASPCPLVDGPATHRAWKAAIERDARIAKGNIIPGASPTHVWEAFLPAEWSEWGNGTIYLCDQGCTYSAHLVVTGESRGRVVYLDAQLWYPPYFVRDLSFLDWYERWLDQTMSGEQPIYFGFDSPEYAA